MADHAEIVRDALQPEDGWELSRSGDIERARIGLAALDALMSERDRLAAALEEMIGRDPYFGARPADDEISDALREATHD